ncbi:MAG: M50 family metallopeptidase [Oligoflexia bacterium]|nr:M50 family metallopeptidase [Oligoflexia bacterium]
MNQEHRSYSFQLISVRGIPIRVHLSLFLLLAWVVFEELADKGDPVWEVLFVLLLLACVVLHELGHALMAQSFGIKTRDIVLYPFGGIATIMAEAKPLAELLIAIAGPLVNVVIALALAFFVDFPDSADEMLTRNDIPTRLMFANIVLVVFNMIPALPMDGGRVLRAVLALARVPHATSISARISQALSLLMGAYALYSYNPILLIIAVLVFSQASRERLGEKARRLATGLSVRDAMTDSKHLISFSHATTIASAFPVAIKTLQPYFAVIHSGQILGVVEREKLLEAGATAADEDYVGAIMDRSPYALTPNTALSDLLTSEVLRQHGVFVVADEYGFQGLLFRERLLEFLLLNGMRNEHKQLLLELRDSEIQ